MFRKARLASRKEKESVERFERATEAGTKVYDVKTHVRAKFERHRRPRSGGLDDPWSCGGCMCDLWRSSLVYMAWQRERQRFVLVGWAGYVIWRSSLLYMSMLS